MINSKSLVEKKGKEAMEEINPHSLNGYRMSKTQTRCSGLFVLIKFFKKIDFFKVTSAVVATIFLWNQIVWAGDIAVSALDNLNDSQAQTFAPNYLQKQETIHEAIVDQKQAIEEFGANQAALTTSGVIEPPAEEKLDLKGPIGGSSGKAVVSMASYTQPSEDGGTPATSSDGAVLSITTQEGDVIHYRGSAIDYIERPDGSTLRNLRFGVDGSLLDAEIAYQDGTVLIVVDGLLTEAHKPNGIIFFYRADGMVSSMEYPDHSVCTYTYIGSPGNITETIVTGGGKTAHYDASGRLARVEFDNGRIAEYDSGVLLRVHDIDGRDYVYDTTDVQNGDTVEYMVSLKTIISSSGVTYSVENNNITSIGLTGLELSNFNLDASGNVINGTVTYADNSRVLIENGRIRKFTSNIGVSTHYIYSGESVQQAIYSAAVGDTVYLHVGTYHEHLVLSNGINLVGEDDITTIIHGDYQTNSHVIRALGNNRIENITISGSGPYSGAPSSAVRIEGSNIKIRNNRITDNRDYALFIWSGDNILIEKNFFKDNGLGVQLPNSGTTIQYNTFVNNNISINVLNGPATVIRNNIITGSTFQSIYEFSWGAYSSGQPASGYAIVEGNILYGNRERGGYYCRCLPPAVINQTLGNLISNPLFMNPAAGNYSISTSSPAYNKGALLPQALSDSLDTSAGLNIKPIINIISDTGISEPIEMPGAMFDSHGHFITTYDFTDIPHFDTILYDSNRDIKEVRRPDGSVISYSGGLIDNISDGAISTGYSYELTALGDINSLTIDRDGIRMIYDKYGAMTSIISNDVVLSMDNGAVSRIEKVDGTVIEVLEFGEGVEIERARITRPDDTVALYEGGALVEIDHPDGSKFFYDAQGAIVRYEGSSGVIYDYSDVIEGDVTYIIATARGQDLIEDEDEIIYQKYGPDKRLLQLRRKNGQTLNYSYTVDGDGKITSTMASDDKIITTYDGLGNIVRSEVLGTTADPKPTISEYEYNRIRRIYKASDLIYRYTYEFDSEGRELTVVEDVATGDFKRYRDSLLVSVTDSRKVATSYEYNSDNKISKSTVTRSGKLISRYLYTYENGITVIEDMDGVKRSYDQSDKLVYIEEEGRTYACTYTTDDQSNEMVTRELVRVRDAAGNIMNYNGNGLIESIVRLDGTVLRDFVLINKTVTDYIIEKVGIKYYVSGDKIIKEIRVDGTILEYYENGYVKFITLPNGTMTNYSYEFSGIGGGEIAYITAEKGEIKYRYDKDGVLVYVKYLDDSIAYYDNQNRLMRLVAADGSVYNYFYNGADITINMQSLIKYSTMQDLAGFSSSDISIAILNDVSTIKLERDALLDFGTGSDGDLRVESGQTVTIDGTKNYKSIYVASGATLTVSPWDGSTGGEIQIKCQGSVIIDGVLNTNAKGYRGGSGGTIFSNGYIMGFDAKQGESYEGSGGYSISNNYGGGGGAYYRVHPPNPYDGKPFYGIANTPGAGGGYGSPGGNAISVGSATAIGGSVYGDAYLTNFYMGSGGGAGLVTTGGVPVGIGGNGGGKIKITGRDITISGIVSANGGDGTTLGGGGSGGAIWIVGENVNIAGSVQVSGGQGSSGSSICGGNGGYGRIRINYGTLAGNIPADAYTQHVNIVTEGVLTSNPISITATEFGVIIANTDTPAGTSIRFKTRTGASSNVDDGTWNAWTETTNTGLGYTINSSVNKYIQYQAILETTDISKTPSIYSGSGYIIKLSCTYSRTFNAAVPPDDILFKDRLTLSSATAWLPLQFTDLRFDPEKISEALRYLEDYAVSSPTIAFYTIKKGASTYFVEGGVVTKEVKDDGTIIEYYPNDWAKLMIAPNGTVTNYSYEFSDGNNLSRVIIEKDGIKYRYNNNGVLIDVVYLDDSIAYYDSQNRLMQLVAVNGSVYNYSYDGADATVDMQSVIKYNALQDLTDLSGNNLSATLLNSVPTIKLELDALLDFGTGSDGDLRVESGQTVTIDGIKNYRSIYVASGAILTISAWDGSQGGELILKCQGEVRIDGMIMVSGIGYRGGIGYTSVGGNAPKYSTQGESYAGTQGYLLSSNYGGGGGAAFCYVQMNTSRGPILYIDIAGGAGGSYGAGGGPGATCYVNSDGLGPDPFISCSGATYDDQYLDGFYRGSGGGAGYMGVAGGNGGDKIRIIGRDINISGTVSSSGGDGTNGSGGGSGGSIWITGGNVNIAGLITAGGGHGGAAIFGSTNVSGGNGGDGRIRIDYGTLTGNIPMVSTYTNQLQIYRQGTITSDSIAVPAISGGIISANIDIPAGTSIKFFTHTGGSDDTGDGTWSNWVEATDTGSGYLMNSQPNNYIQYQAVLETTNAAQAPSIYSNGDFAIKLSYVYNRTFDAQAPPQDIVFREHLKLDPQISPETISLQDLRLDPDWMKAIFDNVNSAALSDDAVLETRSFKADVISQITLTDGTVIRYFNNKPVSITMPDGTAIDNIALESYNATLSDYRVENGVLVAYTDAGRDAVIISFTAKNSVGDAYIFKDNVLTEIRYSGGGTAQNPPANAYSNGLLDLLISAFSPDSLVGEKTYKNSEISVSVSKGDKVTYLIDNKIASAYQRYDTSVLELLMDYSYDESGNLILIRLPYARDSIEGEITAARQEVAAEEASYLMMLASQQGLAYTQIRDQIQTVRDQINAERARLQSMLYQQVTRSRHHGWWIFSWTEYYTETVEVPEVRNALNQLNEQERILNEEASVAYAQLSGSIQAARTQLESDATSAQAAIDEQEAAFHKQIIEEESVPVILECYRAILGRDPSAAETDIWLATIDYSSKLDVGQIKAALFSSAERTASVTFVAALKNRISSALQGYLGKTDGEKAAYLATLGLTIEDAVALDGAEVTAILDFLNRQNIHFGRSAFVALEALLKEGSIPYNFEDLAFKAVLVDVFTGSISSFSEGDLLELSMYSLSKVAATYGLTLYNTKLEHDDLAVTVASGGSVIAHLKNNHFVIVTAVSGDGKVTYTEHNSGPNGTVWTVSKEDFQKSWTGYAITKVAPTDNSKIISDETAQRIKGSCLPFLFPLIGAIFGFIAGAATVVVGVIGAIVTGIAAVLGPIIAGIGTLISSIAGFMVGVGVQIFSAIQFVGASLFSTIGGWLGGICSWIGGIGTTVFGASGLGGMISATGFNLTGLGLALGKAVVTTVLSIGISNGLQALGVNSTISSLIGSFLTGGVTGLFNGFSPMNFITGALQSVAVRGVNELGSALGLPPEIISLIGMGAQALIGAGLQGVRVPIDPNNLDLGYKIITGLAAMGSVLNTTILPTAIGEFARYGISYLGDITGIDPRISYLLGSAASAGSSAFFRNITIPGSDIITSISRSVNSAVVSVTVSLLNNINPAISTVLRSTGLMGAVENMLNTEGLFNGVFTILSRVVPTAFNMAGNIVSGLFDGAKTFIELVTENGPLAAMNTALNSLFMRETVETVMGEGGLDDILSQPPMWVTLPDGRIAQEIVLSSSAAIFLDETGEIASIMEDGITSTGSFVWTTDNRLTMENGVVEGDTETGYSMHAGIEGGQTWNITIDDEDGNEVASIDPEQPNDRIRINSVLSSINSEFNFALTNALLYFANSYMARINNDAVESITQKVNAISAGSLFSNTNEFLYALANGIRNPEVDQTKPPQYILNLEQDMIAHNNSAITSEDILPLPLYHGMAALGDANAIVDMLKWIMESQTVYKNSLVRKVQTDLTSYFVTHPGEWNRPVVGMGYSGGFMPFIEAVSYSLYNVKTIVGLGGPSAFINSEIFNIVLSIVQFIANNQIGDAQRHLSQWGFGDSFISNFITAVKNGSDAVFSLLKEILQTVGAITNLGVTTFPYSPLKTDLIVNVWGTEDIFHKLGVVDKRDNFLGKNTYNIEIVGATHFDYMRRDINDTQNPPDIWNNTVASFVTDLILYSEDKDKLQGFLDGNAYVSREGDMYIVRLPGCSI